MKTYRIIIRRLAIDITVDHRGVVVRAKPHHWCVGYDISFVRRWVHANRGEITELN